MSQRAKRYIFDGVLLVAWCLWLSALRDIVGVEFDPIVQTLVCFGVGAVIGWAGVKLFPNETNLEED